MDGLIPRIFGILLCSGALFAQAKLNFVFYGDSLTQSIDYSLGKATSGMNGSAGAFTCTT
jgi:hypothetical protein